LTVLTLRNLSFGLLRVYKALYQGAGLGGRNGKKALVFIQGCQRSGTSMMYWIFERDLRVKVYREKSELSSQDSLECIRLNPLPAVQKTLARDRMPLIVMKPLAESQRATELLDYFPGSKIIWLYRHYQDVAASNLKAFGRDQGIKDLRPIVLQEPHNWRSESVSEETRQTIGRFYDEGMNPCDAAALFWYARNQLFFEQGLNHHPRVIICRYETLVRRPAGVMNRLYAFIGITYPGDQIIRDVHPHAIGKGRRSSLSAAVENLCEEMLGRLDACYVQTESKASDDDGRRIQPAPPVQDDALHGSKH
jgi:hypothetical protein